MIMVCTRYFCVQQIPTVGLGMKQNSLAILKKFKFGDPKCTRILLP